MAVNKAEIVSWVLRVSAESPEGKGGFSPLKTTMDLY